MLLVCVISLAVQLYVLFKPRPYVSPRVESAIVNAKFEPRTWLIKHRIGYGMIICILALIAFMIEHLNLPSPKLMCAHHSDRCFFENIDIMLYSCLYFYWVLYCGFTLVLAHCFRCEQLGFNSRKFHITSDFIKYSHTSYWLCFTSSKTITIPISRINQADYASECIDSMYGSATLSIDSASTYGPTSTPDLIIYDISNAQEICDHINMLINSPRVKSD